MGRDRMGWDGMGWDGMAWDIDETRRDAASFRSDAHQLVGDVLSPRGRVEAAQRTERRSAAHHHHVVHRPGRQLRVERSDRADVVQIERDVRQRGLLPDTSHARTARAPRRRRSVAASAGPRARAACAWPRRR
jgi:hypothetical protein